jgi:hypothetical protein
VHPAICVLLRRAIDYAGLFPPASLDMHAAVAEYREQANGPDAWALGRFVLPAARLDELDAVASELVPRDAARSWAFSALLGSDIEEDIDRIERFNAAHRDVRAGAVHVDTVELKTHAVHDVGHAAELLDRRFDTYMEIPITDDPAPFVDAISQTRAKAKVRTGGVTTDAFPSCPHLLRFVAKCVERGVAFKATAGLHHPCRGEYRLTYQPDAPRGTMFGFLNLLLATAAIVSNDRDLAAKLLAEQDASSLRLGEGGIEWRGQTIPVEALDAAREHMTAFGSCSFREPLADLRSAHLL